MLEFRFSPIENKELLLEAVTYTAGRTRELCKGLLGSTFPISSVTIFTHFEDEFDRLSQMLEILGTPYGDTSITPCIGLYEPILIGNNALTHISLALPDDIHHHVGSATLDILDYDEFKEEHLSAYPENMRLLEEDYREIIEIFDDEFDILARVESL